MPYLLYFFCSNFCKKKKLKNTSNVSINCKKNIQKIAFLHFLHIFNVFKFVKKVSYFFLKIFLAEKNSGKDLYD